MGYEKYYGCLLYTSGVETRTSAPLKIVRLPDRLRHVEIEGLYPCGEGAGYAGGIISAAMDGEKCADCLLYTSRCV